MRISDFGIQVDVPATWYGRLFQIIQPSVGPPTLHVSSRPLLERDDSMSNFASYTIHQMQPTDATIALVSWSREPRAVFNGLSISRLGPQESLQIGPQHFLPVMGIASSQTSAYRLFTKMGRYFTLLVAFGTPNPSGSRINDVNAILASLQFGPSRAKQRGGNGDLVVFVPPAGLETAPPSLVRAGS